jgi:sporulation protein YlmC with PRC-barrel domain
MGGALIATIGSSTPILMKNSPLKTATVVTLVLGLNSALMAERTPPGPPSQAPHSPAGQQAGIVQSSVETPPARTPRAETAAQSAEIHEDARGRQASALIGREVVGARDVKLGQLDDFIVDADSGRIIYGVVSSVGTNGAGGGFHAVPFTAFIPELAPGGLRMRLNVEEAVWTKAPHFEKGRLEHLIEGMLREDTYQHYGLQPPFKTQPAEQRQRLVLVRELLGKELHRGDRSIGKIEDVIVHLESQMAALLLDPRDDFVQTDQKFILPFGSIALAENKSWGTTLSAQDFTAAQASTDATWAMSSGAFRTPYLWPAYGASATPLASTAPAIIPPVQNRGLSASRPPIEEIRETLAADPHTRLATVKVIAAHDRVILQGVVQDEDDKRRVENRAAESAGGWKIDNQLRIAGAVE